MTKTFSEHLEDFLYRLLNEGHDCPEAIKVSRYTMLKIIEELPTVYQPTEIPQQIVFNYPAGQVRIYAN